jgi:translation initiation factor 1
MPGLFAGTPLERPVTCEVCGKPLEECRCPRNAAGQVTLAKDQPARVRRERRAGGKWVTVVDGLDPRATDLAALLKRLKAACAAGGGVTESGVEIQGDHRERVVTLLKEMGYPAKAAGG